MNIRYLDKKNRMESLLMARGPCGEEEEIRNLLFDMVSPLADRTWVDDAGNLIAFTKGTGECAPEKSVRVLSHMDELSMIVKKIKSDGTLQLRPLGQLYAAKIGEGPVEILGEKQIIPGVFSFGSTHISTESAPQWDLRKSDPIAVSWDQASVFTNLSQKELENLGVHPGTRVVIAQHQRKIWELSDGAWASHFMDNRAPIAAALSILERLKNERTRPLQDTYWVFTTIEEITADGSCFASRQLPGTINIALEVAPIAPEYPIAFNDQPVIAFMDRFSLYDSKLAHALIESGKCCGARPQSVIWENLGSDASIPKHYGLAPRAGYIGIPTVNTHGFEVIHHQAIDHCGMLLYHFLTQSTYLGGSYEREHTDRCNGGYPRRKLPL